MQKRGLGRGLEAILGAAAGNAEELREIAVDEVLPNPNQPRSGFAPDKLQELAASIQEHGVVQPILVRPFGDRYELIAGERRWRAARLAGLGTVPAIVRSLSDRESLEIALVENLQREDLSAIEEAKAYRLMMGTMNMTQEQVATRIGVSRPAVANALRLLSLPAHIQELVERGEVSAGHARALVGLDEQTQAEMVQRIAIGELTVRDLEDLTRRAPAKTQRTAKGQQAFRGVDPDVAAVESQLCQALGTQVRLLRRGQGGRLVIQYYSDEELERLLEALLGADGQGSRQVG